MLQSSRQKFHTLSARRKLALLLALMVWFGSTLLVLNHNPQHSIDQDSHCALCIAQANVNHALLTSIAVYSCDSFKPFIQYSSLQTSISAYLAAPGIRDPPFSV